MSDIQWTQKYMVLHVHCSCLEAVIPLDGKILDKLSILGGMQSKLQENGSPHA